MAGVKTGSVFAGYRVEGVAGRGGMGVVYVARQVRPDRLVALKVLAPELAQDADFRQRFERESQIAASIEHPNVIPVYEVNEADGLLFIAMRFVEGADLRGLIDRGIDALQAGRIVEQVGAALDAAHARGLVHRDVKPGNILVSEAGGRTHAYLTDFGLTKRSAASTGLTKTGSWVGTLDYVAPEQIEGRRIDARTDVYALTGVLFHALSGQVPYPRDNDVATLWAHLNEDPASLISRLANVPDGFQDVVRRGMAKDPDARYPSAGDLGRAALAIVEDRPVAALERSVATGQAAPEPGAANTGHGAAGDITERSPRRAAGTVRPETVGSTARTRVLGSRRRRVAIALTSLVVVAAGTASVVMLGSNPAEKSGPSQPRSAGTIVEPAIPLPGGPRAIAATEGEIWVTDEDASSVTRLSARTGRVEGSVPVGRVPSGVAIDKSSVWVSNSSDNTVTRIDLRSSKAREEPIKVGRRPTDLAVGYGSVWTSNWADDSVSRIDSRTLKVTTIAVGDGPYDIAVGHDAVWVVNVEGDTVSRINPGSNETVGAEIPVGQRPESITVGAGAVWVANFTRDTVRSVDPIANEERGDPIPVGNRPDDLAVADGDLFVVNQDGDSLTRIDPQSRKRIGRPLKVSNAPSGIAVGEGLLWVASFRSQNVVRVRP